MDLNLSLLKCVIQDEQDSLAKVGKKQTKN